MRGLLLSVKKVAFEGCPLSPSMRYSSAASLIRNSTSQSDGASTLFADFSIYKGKAALVMAPLLPKFVKKDSGISVMDKGGSVMLKFVPAIGHQKYDWQKKQIFALSPTELGCLISLGPTESCEFMHDPSMKSSCEGQIKKTLSVKPTPTGDGSYFIGLTVNNTLERTMERISIPTTKAEFAVMRTSFSFILPHIMGWNQKVVVESGGHSPSPSRQVTAVSPDAEWSR